MIDFWKAQTDKLLFPEIAWNKPEQKSQAGKILIIGGGAGSFRSLSLSFEVAKKIGAGQVRVLAPDSLKKNLKIDNIEVIFAPSNNSGGFSAKAWTDLKASENWADIILFIGDTNQNSETAILFEKFLLQTEKPVLITRDTIDILINSFSEILEKSNISIFASFAQLQKIFSNIFYPKVLTFSITLPNLVDTLHKFTLSFPCQIITFHNENLLVADNGEVFSMPISASFLQNKILPLQIWTGEIPTKIAIFQMWNSQKNRARAAITALTE